MHRYKYKHTVITNKPYRGLRKNDLKEIKAVFSSETASHCVSPETAVSRNAVTPQNNRKWRTKSMYTMLFVEAVHILCISISRLS